MPTKSKQSERPKKASQNLEPVRLGKMSIASTEFPTWTPIDSPPDEDLKVLICSRLWSDPVCFGYIDANEWFFDDGTPCEGIEQPTHWMELPEPA